ncbi:ABC transporter permease [Vibrio ruber]|uniref:ABC transporter permease n=1 Tax=Vibrio ruber TaxID=184755 RepID=UPI002892E97B|nr:ABC transporter permease [Vibrio ruber]WNJ95290.1 ABC transporter permease [Vibrio ruber]
MNSVIDISWWQLAIFSLTLLIPLAMSVRYHLMIGKDIVISVFRMGLQLCLVGIYLEYLFALNSLIVNTCWLFIIIGVGASAILSKAHLPKRRLIIPLMTGMMIGLFPILAVLCLLIVQPVPFYNTQYMIPLAGMLMGNTLSGNIVALQNLFSAYQDRRSEYEAALSLGASPRYASRPFIQNAIQKANAPILASMATIGLVTLPGMMTGQILGGASPIIAAKYQFMIMIAIFVMLNISLALSIEYMLKAVLTKEGKVLVQFKKSPSS